MQATSSAQFDAEAAGTLPPLEQLRPNIWALPLAMPIAKLPYMLSYLIQDARGGVHVIDPGWDSDTNWQLVEQALVSIGSSLGDVRSLTFTHLHRDHVGLTPRYRELTPARLRMSRVEQAAIHLRARAALEDLAVKEARAIAAAESWGVPAERIPELAKDFDSEENRGDLDADELFDEGDDLDVPGVALSVIATPGHTMGSVCIAGRAERVLFTGDHILPTIFAGLGLGGPTLGPRPGETNPVSDYVDSVAKLEPYDDFEVLPGHGFRFTGLAERRSLSVEHHLRRYRETEAVLDIDPTASVWEIASRLHWTYGWDALRGPLLRSALSQTAWHMQRADALAR